jgi:serine protease Do
MRGSVGWIAGAAALVLAGLVVGVIITTNSALAPPSVAQEERPVVVTSPGVAAAVAQSPFVAVADRVLPAVVSVDTKRTVRRSANPFRDQLRDFFGERFFRDNFGDEEYREFEVPGSASGFIFDPRGYIMTNNHVVRGADELEVTLMDGREYRAEIVGQDPNTDIAVIRIDGDDLPSVRLGDSDAIKVGGWAIAIGNPLQLTGTVTVGVISAMGRADLHFYGGAPLYQDFIQTDASINFGNSGGPLVDIDGTVIGVNTAINASADGIGFAIPINLAKHVAESLISEGKVVRGFLGIVPQEITNDLAEAKNLDDTNGVIVASVEEDAPADKAGLKPGDVIVEFAGREIESVAQFRRVVAGAAPGDPVGITVVRDGRRKSMTATLVDRPEEIVSAKEEEAEDGAEWFGITATDLDDPLADDYEIDAEEGVLVADVEGGSPAADGGLLPGDVILKIGDRDVTGLDEYRVIMKDLEGHDRAVAFMVQRGTYTYFVAIKPER